jgi:hypothetical protein
MISWPTPNSSELFLLCLIELAREVDAFWVLPSAFYTLSYSFNAPFSDADDRFGMEIFYGVVHASTRLSE